jgi:hypothetical protein
MAAIWGGKEMGLRQIQRAGPRDDSGTGKSQGEEELNKKTIRVSQIGHQGENGM